MKQLSFAAFIAFWSSTITLLIITWLAPASHSGATEEQPGYTLQEVAKHNNLEDCWMAIQGKVYDFSAYIPKHPAPAAVMSPWCGKDATEGMKTKGYGNNHSNTAWDMMASYHIGALLQE